MDHPEEPQEPARPGDLIAAGKVDGEYREFTIRPLTMQPTATRLPLMDPLGAPWVEIGFEICSRKNSEHPWRAERMGRFSSSREALFALAENFELPDDILRYRLSQDVRASLRQATESDSVRDEEDESL